MLGWLLVGILHNTAVVAFNSAKSFFNSLF